MNNNTDKNTGIQLFPGEFEKCFFAIESEFQNFEKIFLRNQLKNRTSLKMFNVMSVNPIGIDFLIFFTGAIEHDLNIMGQAICKIIHAKLKATKTRIYNAELTDKQKLELDYFISQLIK